MPFEILLDHELYLIKVVISGEIFQSEGEEIISTARLKAAEQDYNILYDMRQATTTVLMSNWFNLPRRLEVFNDKKAYFIKAAVLASPKDKAFKEYKFYETVTSNMGLKLKVFTDEAKALSWLNNKSIKTHKDKQSS